jgi:signal transduction histidine kinase
MNSGEYLGLIVLARRRDEAFDEQEERILREASRQVGLALHNTQLDTALRSSLAELERQASDLEQSRARLVVAADEERRRIERDLHDGVQQQVVVVIAALGALPVLLGEGSPAATAARGALTAAHAVLAELREVVDGVQPPVLRDHGLVTAVESRAALLPVRVRVRHEGPTSRWPADVESAAYYVVSEALTNVVKHSGADAAEVLVAATVGGLLVSVSDDGAGLPPGASGSGLAGLRDRVEALGGRFDVTAASPGASSPGTVVTAELPAGHGDDD